MKYELYRILFYKGLEINPMSHEDLIKWNNIYEKKDYNNNNFIYYFFIRNVALSYSLENQNLYCFLKLKYQVLKSFLNNSFYSPPTLEKLLILNGKCFKWMVALKKFYLILCSRQSPKISLDLSLNPIDNNMKNVILLREQKTNYLFKLSDLYNIVINNLTDHNHFFLQIKTITNPYTNLPFTIHNMYNIYFALKQSNLPFCILLHQLYLENFCIKCFQRENEYIIKDEVIKRFVKYGHNSEIAQEIKFMLNSNKYTNKWSISPDFPEEELIKIFKPFLHMRLYNLLGPSECEKYQVSKLKLDFYLCQLYKSNPTFGRKIIRLKPRRTEFITECISYVELEKKYSEKDFSNSILSSLNSFVDVYNMIAQFNSMPSFRIPSPTLNRLDDQLINIAIPHFQYELAYDPEEYGEDVVDDGEDEHEEEVENDELNQEDQKVDYDDKEN